VTRIRHLLEYAALRVVFFVADVLPRRLVEGLVRRAADLCYALFPSRRRIAEANLRRSGIAADPAAARRLARESYRHLALVLAESTARDHWSAEDVWEERVALDAPEEVLALLREEKRGVIVVSGHLGNWEVGVRLMSLLKPLFAVARPMNNPYTDRLVKRRRFNHRIHFTPKHDRDRRRFIRALERGEGVGIMMDQHAGKRGVLIDFFDIPAATHPTAARLHLLTGVPIVFGYCLRTAPGRYRLTLRGPIVHEPTGNKKQDVRAILNRITRLLEEGIRSCPEQYLWAHRRWRTPEATAHAQTGRPARARSEPPHRP